MIIEGVERWSNDIRRCVRHVPGAGERNREHFAVGSEGQRSPKITAANAVPAPPAQEMTNSHDTDQLAKFANMMIEHYNTISST